MSRSYDLGRPRTGASKGLRGLKRERRRRITRPRGACARVRARPVAQNPLFRLCEQVIHVRGLFHLEPDYYPWDGMNRKGETSVPGRPNPGQNETIAPSSSLHLA